MERVMLFIDAGYILEGARKRRVEIDYTKFVKLLEEQLQCEFTERLFFTSAVKDANQAFLNMLRSPPPNGPHFRVKVHEFKKRTCKKCKGIENVQKGVDVAIATQILKASFQRQCNRIVFVSGDGDFEDSLRISKEEYQMNFTLVGFNDRSMSPSICQYASSVLYLDQLVQFFQRGNQPNKWNGQPNPYNQPNLYNHPNPYNGQNGQNGQPIFNEQGGQQVGKRKPENLNPKPYNPPPKKKTLASDQQQEILQPSPQKNTQKKKDQVSKVVNNAFDRKDSTGVVSNLHVLEIHDHFCNQPNQAMNQPLDQGRSTGQPIDQPIEQNNENQEDIGDEIGYPWECHECFTENTGNACKHCGWECFQCQSCTYAKGGPVECEMCGEPHKG